MKIDKTLKGVCLVVGSTLLTVPTFAKSYELANAGRPEIHGMPYAVGNPLGVMNAVSVPKAGENPGTSVGEQGLAEAAALRQLIAVYGDADGSIEALAAQLEQVTDETAEELFAQAAAKKVEVKASYDSAVAQLSKLIARSKSYYEKWQDRAGMDELKSAYEEAEEVLRANSQEQTKNIVALTDAHAVLYRVYDAKGGNSDPAQYADDLKEQIAEAERYQQKYNYLSLGQAIKEAKSYQNSSKTTELQAQTRALKNEIDRTKVQYQSLVKRMDSAYSETIAVLHKRFGESIPQNFQTEIDQVHTALLPAEVQPDGIERSCTDMEQLQRMLDRTQALAHEADQQWNQSVANLKESLADAYSKYTSSYPDNEELGAVVEQVTLKLRTIESLDPQYETVASVDAVRGEIEEVMMRLEANERRNMADNFVIEYKALQEQYALYGSDENSVPTSNVKVFLADYKALFLELLEPDLVHYNLKQLDHFYQEVLKVKSAYTQFCEACQRLDQKMEEGEEVSQKYYNKAEGTGIDKALKHACQIRTESMNIDSVLVGTYALQDSIQATQGVYKEHYLTLLNARGTAYNSHLKFYGVNVTSSEILDVYQESAAYVDLGGDREPITNIFSMIEMTGRLNNCYKQAADSCALLSEALQEVIDQASLLNNLMNKSELASQLAQAINAQYASDARIQAIIDAQESLSRVLERETYNYEQAALQLKEIVEKAETTALQTGSELLAEAARKASLLADNADPQNEKATPYSDLVESRDSLITLIDSEFSAWNQLLGEAVDALKAARRQALDMHNLYYGPSDRDSEILEVYNRSGRYLQSTDIEAIQDMTAELKASYLEASIKNSKSEANLKGVISRTRPLSVLMEDEAIVSAIAEAEAALDVQEARIKALDDASKALQPVYDTHSKSYDKAVVTLGDTLQVSKDLLMQVRDDELKQAIELAEEAFVAADKTSEEGTRYAELNLQVENLAKENARVRDIIASGIDDVDADDVDTDDVDADDPEVIIYTLQGVPVKKARLSDRDALSGLPAGIYVAGGKKIIID